MLVENIKPLRISPDDKTTLMLLSRKSYLCLAGLQIPPVPLNPRYLGEGVGLAGRAYRTFRCANWVTVNRAPSYAMVTLSRSLRLHYALFLYDKDLTLPYELRTSHMLRAWMGCKHPTPALSTYARI